MARKRKKSVEQKEVTEVKETKEVCKDCKHRLSGAKEKRNLRQGFCTEKKSFVSRKAETCGSYTGKN